MESGRSELRWGVEQRLEFIEFRLFWEGHVNRSDLMDQFGVSVNQASTDLNRYISFAPDNMVYDKSARTYVRGSGFKPHFLEPDASRYVAQLRSVADGILDREDSWIAGLPPYAAALIRTAFGWRRSRCRRSRQSPSGATSFGGFVRLFPRSNGQACTS
jgi:hypothetical protein